jgi:hypothetical protein
VLAAAFAGVAVAAAGAPDVPLPADVAADVRRDLQVAKVGAAVTAIGAPALAGGLHLLHAPASQSKIGGLFLAPAGGVACVVGPPLLFVAVGAGRGELDRAGRDVGGGWLALGWVSYGAWFVVAAMDFDDPVDRYVVPMSLWPSAAAGIAQIAIEARALPHESRVAWSWTVVPGRAQVPATIVVGATF